MARHLMEGELVAHHLTEAELMATTWAPATRLKIDFTLSADSARLQAVNGAPLHITCNSGP